VNREPVLACSVRACGEPLVREGQSWGCPRGHAFDLARSGYLNLLQPQDRRSSRAGDTPAALAARGRLGAAGIGRRLDDEILRGIRGLGLRERAVLLELGSGTGALLARLQRELGLETFGIDLSRPAIEHAARNLPGPTWIVANADRRLPIRPGAVDLVLSIHGRRNPAECARVLRSCGRLLVAVPAADDLLELRAAVQGAGLERERVLALLAELEQAFVLLERCTVRERRVLARAELLDLLVATYRGARAGAEMRVAALSELALTFASELLLFAPRSAVGSAPA